MRTPKSRFYAGESGRAVAGPLIVISTFRVRQGAADELRQYYARIAEIVEAKEPRVIAFNGILNDHETELTSIQVHPDTDSMDYHLKVLTENWDESFSRYAEVLGSVSIEYYGTTPASALEMDAGREGVSVKSRHVDGFIRTVG